MRLRKLLFSAIPLSFLGLFSCGDSEQVKPVSTGMYFDVPGFVQQKLQVLKEQQPALQKTVGVNQEKPEIRQLQNVNWENELQHFLEIDLNKKALGDAYTVSETQHPDGKTVVYELKPEQKAAIKSVTITTDPENKVKQLRAVSEEENGLFYSREVRLMALNEEEQVKTYQISGVQKVLLFDSLRYRAGATVMARSK